MVTEFEAQYTMYIQSSAMKWKYKMSLLSRKEISVTHRKNNDNKKHGLVYVCLRENNIRIPI